MITADALIYLSVIMDFLFLDLSHVFAEKEGRGELAIKLPLPPGALTDLYKATDVYTEKYLTTYVALSRYW